MARADWIADVLRDIGNFAEKNQLPKLEQSIRLSQEALCSDLRSRRSEAKLSGDAGQMAGFVDCEKLH